MTHSFSEWAIFGSIIVALLAFDLGVANKRSHAISLKEATAWSVVWVLISLAFGGWIYLSQGADNAGLYLTGYILEKSLSVDNLAVFIMVFAFFGVDSKYHHRVLYWGVLGAIIMRVLILGTGTALIAKVHWLLFVCAFILALGAWKMYTSDDDDEADPEALWIVRKFRQFFPISAHYNEDRFMVKEADANGVVRNVFTPLAVVLISIEAMDLIFATDSIPTILSVSTDPYIIITSNIFAILGLRSLFFVLDALLPMLCYLKKGVALVLGFIAVKLVLVSFGDIIELINSGLSFLPFLGQLPVVHGPEIPVAASLSVVFSILTASVLLSVLFPKKEGNSAS
jgi:tellurite resistance protein TerC